DHRLGQTTIISTGLGLDGTRSEEKARRELEFWRAAIQNAGDERMEVFRARSITSNMTAAQYQAAVEKVLRYIRHGDIYQVNIAHRLGAVVESGDGWALFQRLLEASPAPFAAYMDGGNFELASSSPERFLRFSGSHVQTRPIKGTRPRDPDPTRDAQLTYE